jgi:hypothetical protein
MKPDAAGSKTHTPSPREHLNERGGDGNAGRGRVEVGLGVMRAVAVVDEELLDPWTELLPQAHRRMAREGNRLPETAGIVSALFLECLFQGKKMASKHKMEAIFHLILNNP